MASYATPADMINAFDSNVLGDVVSDIGSPVNEAGLLTDAKLLSALSRASGIVEGAVLAGGMYTVEQLGDLTGNGQALLVDITCCIAMCRLLRRRPTTRLDELQKAVCGDAEEMLQSLRKGDMVFGGTTNATDGVLPETVGPTTETFVNLNMTVDRVKGYFPRRGLPNGR